MSAIVRDHYNYLINQAHREGMCFIPDSKSAARHLLRLAAHPLSGIIAPAKSLYASGAYWEGLSKADKHLHIARSLTKKHPTWVFCHFTAAAAYGLSLPYRKLDFIHVAQTPKRRFASTDLIKRHEIKDIERTWVQGIPVTSLERTMFDCLCRLNFRDGLALADSALRQANQSRSWLEDALDNFGGQGVRGIRQARTTASYADARSESGGESIARAAMIELGYALPDLQVELPDVVERYGHYRVDFLWNIAGQRQVIGEFDGREKYVNPAMTHGQSSVAVMANERIRESRLSALGIPVMRLCYDDVRDDLRLMRLLDSYGIPKRSYRRPSRVVRVPFGQKSHRKSLKSTRTTG